MPEPEDFENYTAFELLMTAIEMSSLDLVQEILSEGVDLSATDENQRTPLLCATLKDDINIAKLLLKNDKNAHETLEKKDLRGWNPLIVAAGRNNANLVQLFLQYGSDIKATDLQMDTASLIAARYKCLDSLKILFSEEKRQNILEPKDKNGNTALWIAIGLKDVQIMQILMSLGADLQDRNLVSHAVLKQDRELLRLLIKYNANIDIKIADQSQITPLIQACDQEDRESVKILLEGKANPYVKDAYGMNALKIASNLDNIKDLIKPYVKGDFGIFRLTCNLEVMAGLLYSRHNFPMHDAQTLNHFTIATFASDFEEAEFFLKMLDSLSKKDYFYIDERRKMKMVYLPYLEHSSGCMVSYEDNIPVTVSYLDGNLPLSPLNDENKGFGEIVFKVDSVKIRESNIENKIVEAFSGKENEVYDGQLCKEAQIWSNLAKFVVCDEKGRPVIINSYHPCQPQARGKCSGKLVTLALRSMLNAINPQLLNLYKKYKNFLIRSLKEDFSRLAQLIKEEDSAYQVLIDAAKSLILQACHKGDIEFLNNLSDFLKNANFSAKDLSELKTDQGENLLFLALKSKNPASIEWCLANKIEARPNALGLNPFIFAIKTPEILNLFLKYQIFDDINAHPQLIQDSARDSIFAAIEEGRGDIVEFFIKSGLNLNVKNNDGATPLAHALSCFDYREPQKTIALINLLATKENLLEAIDEYGTTPLHLATTYANLDIIRTIVEKNSETINAKDAQGLTPFEIAKINKDEKVMKYLMEKFNEKAPTTSPSTTPHGVKIIHLAGSHQQEIEA